MSNSIDKKTALTVLTIVLVMMAVHSCTSPNTNSNTFSGDEKAVLLAEQMFTAIGGKKPWCELKSLYIKATHTEPQKSEPYMSEIWRGIDRFEMVMEQQNDDFHVKAVVDSLGGTVRYYDNRDTFRVLTKEQLSEWKFEHNHNIYVLLHNFGCNPTNYRVQMEKANILTFYEDTVFLARFELDDQLRPHVVYHPNVDGSIAGSVFTHWGTDGGLIHSAGGHPLDSSFFYQTKIWQPATNSLKEKFGKEIFNIDQ